MSMWQRNELINSFFVRRRTYPNKIFCRVFGLFWKVFGFKFGDHILLSIWLPNLKPKIGPKEPKNRLKNFIRIGSQTHFLFCSEFEHHLYFTSLNQLKILVKNSKQRVLVTGGAGFIGSHLVEFLLSQGHHVTVVDNLCNGKLSNLKNCEGHPQFQFIQTDIRKCSELKGIFSGIHWVFHLAALSSVITSIEKPRDYFETNVNGTYNVLEASHQAGVQRFIYAASSSCYGNADQYPTSETASICPQSPYALTKYLAELLVLQWAQIYQLPALSLRLFNVFGPRLCIRSSDASVFGVFLSQKARGESLTIVGDGEQTRDFIYITDVVEAFYAAAKSNFSNDTLNVGSGRSCTINSLAQILGGEVRYVPKRAGESISSLANIEKISKKLSWKPKISFEEGMAHFLRDCR
jgi:UDP-glucose 4-epimerase